MRVVHVQEVAGIGGSERHLLVLLPELQARGVDVDMVVLANRDALRFVTEGRAAGIPTHVLSAGPDIDLRLVLRLQWNLHHEPHDHRRFTWRGLRQLLAAHGFEPLAIRRIGDLLAVVGSRLVDGISTELYSRMRFLPPRVPHALVLLYPIPMSLVFSTLSRYADRLQSSDAMARPVLARRRTQAVCEG